MVEEDGEDVPRVQEDLGGVRVLNTRNDHFVVGKPGGEVRVSRRIIVDC
jgi:hypothetical protein